MAGFRVGRAGAQRVLTGVWLVAMWLAPRAAPAEAPGLWGRARDPASLEVARVRRAAERLLGRADEAGAVGALAGNFVRSALAILELARDQAERDPWLALLRATLLGEEGLERWREVRRIVEPLSNSLPPDLRARSLSLLATACAKLGDRRCEVDAGTRALDLAWEPDARGTLHLNRAEARMLQGDLAGARADYGRALALATSAITQALARYGLGVALERSGDLPGALAEIRLAAATLVPPFGSALDVPGVFFVPPYEKHYYRALEQMALARDAGDSEARVTHLRQARDAWGAYLEGAEPEGAEWVVHARAHRARVGRELEARPPGASRHRR